MTKSKIETNLGTVFGMYSLLGADALVALRVSHFSKFIEQLSIKTGSIKFTNARHKTHHKRAKNIEVYFSDSLD